MADTYTVQLPNGQTITRQLPKGATDAMVRAAFKGAMVKHGIDANRQSVQRPKTLGDTLGGMFGSNEDYWRKRLGNQGAISNRKATLGDLIQEKLTGGLRSAGLGDAYAKHLGDRAFNFLNDLTPVGDAVSAGDAKKAWEEGRPVAAAGNALLAALGSVPGVGDALAGAGKAATHAIIAPLFHGSPHKFDKFSLDKIGTGEGAQAYGHGLYFAENPAVARDYRNTLTVPKINGRDMRMNETEAWGALNSANGDLAAALARAEHELAQKRAAGIGRYDIEPVEDRVGTLRAWQRHGVPQVTDTGHLYEVQLNAEPEDFLDWDAPLAQQPDAVRSAYADAAIPNRSADPVLGSLIGSGPVPNSYLGLFDKSSGAQAYNTLAERVMTPNTLGLVAEHNARRLAAERLRQSGVPGLKYFDQGSRRAADGTRNYVVFDDSLIDILARH